MDSLHDFTVETIEGQERSLGEYAGKTLLVVNVASRCGLTPQYRGLQALQTRFADRGFSVLGFPCNQFAGQEPGTNAEILEFCTTKYDVTFPLFAKLDVNGDGRAPLFQFLTQAQSAPEGAGDIKWNFTKFVVDGQGAVAARFGPQATPESEELVQTIERLLG